MATHDPQAREARHRRAEMGAVPPTRSPRGNGTTSTDERTLGELVRELGDDASRLVREELTLAKAEMREKLHVYERNAGKIAVGAVLLLGAVLVLLVAVNRGLTALLAQFMGVEIAVWLAPLLLAAVAAGVGWSLIRSGKDRIAEEGVAPRRTIDTVKEEKRWIENEVKR